MTLPAADAILAAFDAVADGQRQRSRARTPQGWVRIERLDAERLLLRGPHASLFAVWSARRRHWRCVQMRPGLPSLHYVSRAGTAQVQMARRR